MATPTNMTLAPRTQRFSNGDTLLNETDATIVVSELEGLAGRTDVSHADRKQLGDLAWIVSRRISGPSKTVLQNLAQRMYTPANDHAPKGALGAMTAHKNWSPKSAQTQRANLQASSVDLDSFFKTNATPYEQWQIWECAASFDDVRRPSLNASVSVAHAPSQEVVALPATGRTSAVIQQFETNSGLVAWPRHPLCTSEYNTDWKGKPLQVPFHNAEEKEVWTLDYTASRSMAMGRLGVKMPTNFAVPSNEEPQKGDNVNECVIAVRRGMYVAEAEKRSGVHPRLRLIPDIASYAHKPSMNGIVIRDLSAIYDDKQHLFMPGFALPRYGSALGLDAKELAREAATSWGRTEALLLIRYGLKMKAPHGQNTLFLLDAQSKKFTNAVAFRDLSDTNLVGPIARAIGRGDAVDLDEQEGYTVFDKVESQWQLCIPGLDAPFKREDGQNRSYFDYSTLMQQRPVYEAAYCDQIREELAGLDPEFDAAVRSESTVEGVFQKLVSPSGQRALQAYGRSVLKN